MSAPTKDFTPEAVLAVVAQELRYNAEDLDIAWDEKLPKRSSYLVTGRSNRMEVVVFESEAAAESECQERIAQQLFAGLFFTENEVDREVVEAVAKVCNLADLTSYLTVAAREGWSMPSHDEEDEEATGQILGSAKTVDEIKVNQDTVLARWLKDPVAAIWRLQGGAWDSTMAVLVEQCQVGTNVLTKAIMDGFGGWRSFEACSVIATTAHGYVIVADNSEACDYMEQLFAVAREESPVVS